MTCRASSGRPAPSIIVLGGGVGSGEVRLILAGSMTIQNK